MLKLIFIWFILYFLIWLENITTRIDFCFVVTHHNWFSNCCSISSNNLQMQVSTTIWVENKATLKSHTEYYYGDNVHADVQSSKQTTYFHKIASRLIICEKPAHFTPVPSENPDCQPTPVKCIQNESYDILFFEKNHITYLAFINFKMQYIYYFIAVPT